MIAIAETNIQTLFKNLVHIYLYLNIVHDHQCKFLRVLNQVLYLIKILLNYE